jgi:hypothetical protein
MLHLVRLGNQLVGFGAAVCKGPAVVCKGHAPCSPKGALIQKVVPLEAVSMHHQYRCMMGAFVVQHPKVGLTVPMEPVDASRAGSVSELPVSEVPA